MASLRSGPECPSRWISIPRSKGAPPATIERPKRSLYWRIMNAYADALLFALKILIGIVLCGFSFAAFFVLFTIVR